MFDKIKQFIDDNKPVRNARLREWKLCAETLYDYVDAVEVYPGGTGQNITVTDKLIIIHSDTYTDNITLFGNAKLMTWPESKNIAIGSLRSKGQAMGEWPPVEIAPKGGGANVWRKGDVVKKDIPTIDNNDSVLVGWVRLTDGTANVLGKDWALMRITRDAYDKSEHLMGFQNKSVSPDVQKSDPPGCA
jgi:hypothetical protein